MAGGPVVYRQKQSSRVLRPNWNAVQWPRVFGINTHQMFGQSGEKGEGSCSLVLNAPWDSTAKIYELVRLVYFASSRLAARSAAAPADRAEDDKYEAASVLTTVTSQLKGLPPCHGINVRPSGLLPPWLVIPTGSFATDIPADCIAPATTLFNAWCLIILIIVIIIIFYYYFIFWLSVHVIEWVKKLR